MLAFPGRFAFGIGLSLAVFTWRAEAQPSANDKAAAEALFEQGKSLFDQKQYEQACAKFAASQELDAGFGTLMNLGECFERRGMTASAWATFREAASLARTSGQTDREAAARDRASFLEHGLSKLTVQVPAALQDVRGLEVRLNDTLLPRTVWGTLVPVDPGIQRVQVLAPGYRAWTSNANVPEGSGETSIAVPQLEREAAVLEPTAPRESTGTATFSQVPLDDGRSQRTIGYVLGGAGLLGLAVGSGFGMHAISRNQDSDDFCSTERLCSQDGLDLREDARNAATVSTIAFVAGGALAAGGLALVLTAPSSAHHPGGGQRGAPAARSDRGPTRTLQLISRVERSGVSMAMKGTW